MASSKSFNVEPFVFRVESILLEHGVLEFCLNSCEKALLKDDKKIKSDCKARNITVQCLSDNQLSLVRGKDSAYKMWMALCETYEKKGLCAKLMLKRKLISLKMSDEDNLDEFILKFEQVLEELKLADVTLEDEDIVCHFMMALPKRFETACSIVEAMNQSEVNFQFVKKRMRNEEEKLQAKESKVTSKSDEKQHSFLASGYQKFSDSRNGSTSGHQNSSGNQNSSGRKFVRKCYNCGRPGHLMKECRTKKKNYNNKGYYNFHKNNESNLSNNTSNSPSNKDNVSFNCVTNDKHSEVLMSDNTANGVHELKFYIDSGCTDHLVNDDKYFNNYVKLKEPISISVAKDGESMLAVGVGTIVGHLKCNGNTNICTLRNVLHVPSGRRNLLSVKKIESFGNSVLFACGEAKIFNDKDKLIGLGKRVNLYELNVYVNTMECHLTEDNDVLWHKRYGHISYHGLQQLCKKSLVSGMNISHVNTSKLCEPCLNGKMYRLPFESRKRASRILEIVHSDVCGPISPNSMTDKKYFVTFLDNYSHFCVVYPISNKDEVYEKFCEYYQMTKSKFGKSIHKLRCDNGGEYTSKKMQEYCRQNGVVIDYTVPYTPEQNGKAERLNRTIVEKSRAMINDSGLSKAL